MKVIREREDAELFYDRQNRIIKFVWKGTISYDTLKDLVLATAEIVERQDSSFLLFDRRKLETYSAEAKNWVKNDFMKNDGKRLMKKVNKIAAVNSKSTLAQLISTLLVGVLKIYNRKVQYKMFDTPEEALDWLRMKEAVT